MSKMTTATTTTMTSYGELRGEPHRGVVVFRGIPYARPPVGEWRFARPQAPDRWPNLRNADTFGPAAMQPANPVSGRAALSEVSEDCLYLNIWTPALEDQRRPVLVWLHGGAFTFGAGSLPKYDGAALARRGDLVVVTVNYRLGIFGYLRGIDICGEALPSTGNEGLLDQMAALRWVMAEIARFGGDPENVTVFGQSAGAVSISALLSMPEARGLFHKAILQSGSTNLLLTPDAANQVTEAILNDIGLTRRNAGQLRDVPAAQLLEVQARVTPRARGGFYRPVADDTEIPADPLMAIAAGSAAGIPLLVGTNLDEQKMFRRLEPEVDRLTDEGLRERLTDPRTNAQAGDDGQFDPSDATAVYRHARAARGEDTRAPELWFAIMSDRRFRVPLMRLAELHAAHTAQTYAYLFTWQSPAWNGRLGAGHAVEVPFVFGTLDDGDGDDFVRAGSEVETLSTQMQEAWIAFARSGRPQTPRLPDWEPYAIPRRRTMLLGNSSGLVDAPYEPERQFWEGKLRARAVAR